MTAVYAGSFDPFTNGHLYVLTQSLKIFERVYLVIARHPSKQRRFSPTLAQQSIQQIISDLNLSRRVSVAIHDELTIDFARSKKALFLIRGLRNNTDYDCEEKLAAYNLEHGAIETIYFRAGPHAATSSSHVIKLFQQGKDISSLVPPATLALMQNHPCP
ncbi:pantetheine-phosphate adenylyltransferase [Microgenomates group bacterium]|nr:pantetheine-phosphate adenylyltransferase [Microgenomates group bacterium]